MNLKKYGYLPSSNFFRVTNLSFAFLLIFFTAFWHTSGSALAQDTNNPFANIPKASEFLGSPKEFVAEIEGRVMPVLVQFFTGIATVYSLSQLIKSLKNK